MTGLVCACGSGLEPSWIYDLDGEPPRWHCDRCAPKGARLQNPPPTVVVRPPGRGLPGIPGRRGRHIRRDPEADR